MGFLFGFQWSPKLHIKSVSALFSTLWLQFSHIVRSNTNCYFLKLFLALPVCTFTPPCNFPASASGGNLEIQAVMSWVTLTIPVSTHFQLVFQLQTHLQRADTSLLDFPASSAQAQQAPQIPPKRSCTPRCRQAAGPALRYIF